MSKAKQNAFSQPVSPGSSAPPHTPLSSPVSDKQGIPHPDSEPCLHADFRSQSAGNVPSPFPRHAFQASKQPAKQQENEQWHSRTRSSGISACLPYDNSSLYLRIHIHIPDFPSSVHNPALSSVYGNRSAEPHTPPRNCIFHSPGYRYSFPEEAFLLCRPWASRPYAPANGFLPEIPAWNKACYIESAANLPWQLLLSHLR